MTTIWIHDYNYRQGGIWNSNCICENLTRVISRQHILYSTKTYLSSCLQETSWLKHCMCVTGCLICVAILDNLLVYFVQFSCLLCCCIQCIPRNMHTVFALLCFVVVIYWLIFPYPSGLLHWHCGNLTIAPVPAKQPWWIWINTSCEFIMNDCITTTKQSTTKPCAYFLGYTVCQPGLFVLELYV